MKGLTSLMPGSVVQAEIVGGRSGGVWGRGKKRPGEKRPGQGDSAPDEREKKGMD